MAYGRTDATTWPNSKCVTKLVIITAISGSIYSLSEATSNTYSVPFCTIAVLIHILYERMKNVATQYRKASAVAIFTSVYRLRMLP